MKNLISRLLVAFTVSQIFPAVALAEPEVYGKLLLSVEHIDDETDANDYWDVKSHDSRFGIKGDFATDTDSLKVIYQLEWAVDITDEANSSNDRVSQGKSIYLLERRGCAGWFYQGCTCIQKKTCQIGGKEICLTIQEIQ